MQNVWTIYLARWILNDGNYPVFMPDQDVQFACSFFGWDFSLSESSEKSAVRLGGSQYTINAEVVYIDSDVLVLNFGILAYTDCIHLKNLSSNIENKAKLERLYRFQKSLKPGQMVSAEINVGIDYFAYIEKYCRNRMIPEMIYTWHLDKIEGYFGETMPPQSFVADSTVKNACLYTVSSTYVSGPNGYLMTCTKTNEPPHRDGQRLVDLP